MVARPCLIAFGANRSHGQQTPQKALGRALLRLKSRGVAPRRISGLSWTKAWPDGNEPDYLNCAFLAWTAQTPQQTLRTLLDVERTLGRSQVTRRGPRSADLDLLAYGRLVLPSSRVWRLMANRLQYPARRKTCLVVPHPLLHRRRFALELVCEVERRWKHPVLGVNGVLLLKVLVENGIQTESGATAGSGCPKKQIATNRFAR